MTLEEEELIRSDDAKYMAVRALSADRRILLAEIDALRAQNADLKKQLASAIEALNLVPHDSNDGKRNDR